MTTLKSWIAVLTAVVVLLLASGCDVSGKVEQGRVIAYDKKAALVTLIPEALPAAKSSPGVLPPVTVKVPEDPEEMGPAPAPGKLMRVDLKEHRIVVYHPSSQDFLTIQYTPVAERRNVAKAPATPAVDPVKRTITVYSAKDKALVTFQATDELLAMPADSWVSGDVVRYYYKEPGQALRFMNVTRTDLSKS